MSLSDHHNHHITTSDKSLPTITTTTTSTTSSFFPFSSCSSSTCACTSRRGCVTLSAMCALLCSIMVMTPALVHILLTETQTTSIESGPSIGGEKAKYEKCGHILLFSAPRHGSTWFVDNAEECRYSQQFSWQHSFGSLNLDSEIYNHGQPGAVENITIRSAVLYLAQNMSIKIFPYPFREHEVELLTLAQEAFRQETPIILLTREATSAYASFVEARRSKTWNANRGAKRLENDTRIEGDLSPVPAMENWARFNLDYFQKVRTMLIQMNVRFDEVEYDSIVDQPLIHFPNAACSIANCNFLSSPQPPLLPP